MAMSYRLSMPTDSHDNISCDCCDKSGFSGSRYKCLVCDDYDLCGECKEMNVVSGSHRIDHPMQCILSRRDAEILYAGEAIAPPANTLHSLTCPYCGELGMTLSTLNEHVNSNHSDQPSEVICPVCVGAGDSNVIINDLCTHLSSDHLGRPEPRRLGAVGSGGGGVSALGRQGAVREPQRARRSHPLPRDMTGTIQRESDAIAELLTQLTEARGLRQGVLGTAAAASNIGIAAPQIQQIPLGGRGGNGGALGGAGGVPLRRQEAESLSVGRRDEGGAGAGNSAERDYLLLPRLLLNEERELANGGEVDEEDLFRKAFVCNLLWDCLRKPSLTYPTNEAE